MPKEGALPSNSNQPDATTTSVPSTVAQLADRTPAQERVKEYFRQKPFDELAEDVCVLHSDLVGSTAYKQQHGEEKGLAKVYLHNELSGDAVRQHGGEVCKYLGDGILAVFRGVDATKRALLAAKALLEQIGATNARQKFAFPHDLSTRVSLNRGKVWFYRYAEANAEDPQGLAVDLTARLVKFAEPNHIIMTIPTWEAAEGPNLFPTCSTEPFGRYVAGFLQEQHVLTVALHSDDQKRPKLLPQVRELPVAAQQPLRLAKDAYRTKRGTDAEKQFEEVLRHDKGNFEAHYHLGERCFQRSNGVRTPGAKRLLLEAFEHFCQAKKVRPDIARVWLYLGGTRFKQFVKVPGMNKPEILQDAIQYTEASIARAAEAYDVDSLAEGKTLLARLYLEMHENSENGSPQDLTRAEALCAEVHNLFDGPVDQHRSNLLVTHALVRIAKHTPSADPEMDQELEEINQMILEAQRLHPESIRAKEAAVSLAKLRNHLDDNPSILNFDF